MKIGIIKEGKTPPDYRVPLTPAQCNDILKATEIDLKVQPSDSRCYKDQEYVDERISLSSDMTDRDILLGVKEVPIDQLISDKTYFFFSHTIKMQSYNRDLLRAILDKNITLIDWETLANDSGQRVIAFGRWAGIVGAHNGILTWGKRHEKFDLKPMNQCHDFKEAKSLYKDLNLGHIRVVLTGMGRVANGAAEVLDAMGIKRVSPDEYLHNSFDVPVYTQLDLADMYAFTGHESFDKDHYFKNFKEYDTRFRPYTKCTDIMINGIYWEPGVPAFFTRDQMIHPDFTIQVIADITCDIAPESSIPSTLRPSTIEEPIYGFNPVSSIETESFINGSVDVMAVDNLPNELPRDASEDFGKQFMNYVLPELLKDESEMLERATIAKGGKLGSHFGYLEDYVAGK